jgi:hypothetical protein
MCRDLEIRGQLPPSLFPLPPSNNSKASQSQNFIPPTNARYSTNCPTMTTVYTRKRPISSENSPLISSNSSSQSTSKRYRWSPPSHFQSTPIQQPTPSATLIEALSPQTAPSSPEPAQSPAPTVTLRVNPLPCDFQRIPKNTLASRKAAAKRWETKLQNKFPTESEIRQAYPTKLMRHYPSPDGKVSTEPPFIKPRIQKSLRVMTIMKHFPLFKSPPPTDEHLEEYERNQAIIKANQEITSREKSVKLAWKNFAAPKRSTRGDQLVRDSGLDEDELSKEYDGIENRLPKWKKRRAHPRWVEEERQKQADKRWEALGEARRKASVQSNASSRTMMIGPGQTDGGKVYRYVEE